MIKVINLHDGARLSQVCLQSPYFPVHLLPGYMHHSESDLIVDKPCPETETFLGNLTLPHSARDRFMLSVDHLLVYTFR